MTRGLGVINEQIKIFMNSARELYLLNNSVFREQNNNDVELSLERIRNIEDNIGNIRKK